MAQVTTVTSEALQAKVRQLLPSQQGFGEDLQASNVILPIIDLTETASGSLLRQDLQIASGLTDTSFTVTNATSTLVTGTGFYLINYYLMVRSATSVARDADISVTDGSSTKKIIQVASGAGISGGIYDNSGSVVIFLRSGESITATAIDTASFVVGSLRQIADINGNLINPTGFTAE